MADINREETIIFTVLDLILNLMFGSILDFIRGMESWTKQRRSVRYVEQLFLTPAQQPIWARICPDIRSN